MVAHRGASGYRPEHTLAAYALAIRQGADYIEPDLVSTRDGVLVARHENEISGTTDVADRKEFANRETTKTVDDVETSGWFTEDFTVEELKTLRVRERLPALRPANRRYDGHFDVATLDEILALAARARTVNGGPVGVYPETKHPSYFRSIGLPIEEPLLASLGRHGYGSEAPVFLQSFETHNLQLLAGTTDYRLIQLIEPVGSPYDLVASGDPRTYRDLVSEDGLRSISSYAYGVGLPKSVMIPRDEAGTLLEPNPVVDQAHEAGLTVHGFTFRQENFFLPPEYRSGSDPVGTGDLRGEINAYLSAGLDGIFVDQSDVASRVALEEPLSA
ncbi:MAG TPA: glycerophosphodiester phosphodiesterase [Propionibacteriaceae bacterium]